MTESWKTLKLPLSPTRKASPQPFFYLTGRTTIGKIGTRVSTPIPRCPSPSTPRPGTPYITGPTIVGLSPTDLKRIYTSKCRDLDIPPNVNQEIRFYKICEKTIQNRELKIQEQELGPISASFIGEILQNSLDFCRLNLSTNHIQDSGCLALGKMICANQNIIHVDVSSNELSSDGLKQFIDMLQHSVSLISLDISTYNGINRNRVGAPAAESLSVLINLSKILTYLDLNEVSLNDSGLERLTLGLKDNTSLLRLGLGGNNLTHKLIEEFCQVLCTTNIEELNLSNNKITDNGCKALADLLVFNEFSCKLKKLDISKNDITFKGINGIFLAVRYNPTLSYLNCEANPLGSPTGQSLHFLLMNNYSLTSLNLNSCKLKNEGTAHLAQGLANNKSLKTLNLGNNEIKDIGVKDLCTALIENEILNILDLSYNCIRDGSALTEMLKKNMGLEILNLKENKIKEHFGVLFIEATRAKTNLIKINLEGNHFNSKQLDEIRQNIKKNEYLYNKGKSPTLLKKIEKLQSGQKDIQMVNDEINRKKNEKLRVLNRISQLKQKLNELKANTVDLRLAELKEEYGLLRESSYKMSVELDSLAKETLRYKVLEDKVDREHIDSIAKVIADIKQLEKNKISRKEELALRRSTLETVITQLKSSLETEEFKKRSAYATLAAANCRMLAVQEELNNLKYGESFYKEKQNHSPQPIRVNRRMGLNVVRKERSPVVPARRVFFS